MNSASEQTKILWKRNGRCHYFAPNLQWRPELAGMFGLHSPEILSTTQRRPQMLATLSNGCTDQSDSRIVSFYLNAYPFVGRIMTILIAAANLWGCPLSILKCLTHEKMIHRNRLEDNESIRLIMAKFCAFLHPLWFLRSLSHRCSSINEYFAVLRFVLS